MAGTAQSQNSPAGNCQISKSGGLFAQGSKDLVPDLTNFYAQYASIEPWLKTTTPTPQKEWRQSASSNPPPNHRRIISFFVAAS
jgi:hypothetical protein